MSKPEIMQAFGSVSWLDIRKWLSSGGCWLGHVRTPQMLRGGGNEGDRGGADSGGADQGKPDGPAGVMPWVHGPNMDQGCGNAPGGFGFCQGPIGEAPHPPEYPPHGVYGVAPGRNGYCHSP